MYRMVYPFLSIFSAGLGVELGAMSIALTLRSLSGAAGPFLASVADSRGRKTGMLAGTLLFVLGAALPIFWSSYAAFLLTLVLTSVGYLLFIPSMQAFLGDQVSYRRRGLAIAVTELGWSLSFIIGVPIVGILIDRFGWRSPFPLLAALGLIAFFVFTRILPTGEKPRDIQPKVLTNLSKVFTYPLALAGLASGMLFSTANETINLIFGVWLEDNFGLKVTALGMVAFVIGMAEFAGEGFVGILTDRFGKIRSINTGLVLNCLAIIFLLRTSGWLGGALIGLFVFYLTFEFTLVSAIPLMSELLPQARATLMAMNLASNSLGRAVGAVLSPILYTAGDESGILFNAIAAILLNLLAMVALHRMKRGLVDLE